MNLEETTVSKKTLYDGKIVKLDIHQVLLHNGNAAEREIIEHPGGVCVIPITAENEVYFVSQYRKPYEAEVIEIPAGKLEPNEAPEVCAIRELKEETGLTASKITYLTQMYPSPGYTNEVIHIYKAEELEQGETARDEDEFMDVHKYSLSQALELVKTGVIKDAKTIIAILMCADTLKP